MNNKYIIREANYNDRNDIIEISNNTWDGIDYLKNIFDIWIKDKYFFVLEINNKVIGTAKISLFPLKTAWLEGLRIHKDYQKSGYGKILYNFILNKTKLLKKIKIIENIEFATYYSNYESLSLSKKDNFEVIKKYFVLYKENINISNFDNKSINSITLSSFDNIDFEDYIPIGWEFVRKNKSSLNWVNKNSNIKNFSGNYYLFPKNPGEISFTVFNHKIETIKTLLPALSYSASLFSLKEITLMIPEKKSIFVDLLIEIGFRSWRKEIEPDVLLLQKL